jgi:amidase
VTADVDANCPMPVLADAFVERFTIAGRGAGPLGGTTCAVKDVIDVAGFQTGCGNPTWRATHAPAVVHAEVVQRLLDAGARLVGKTRTDELAYSLDGLNFHEGAPRNPAAPARLTGGSSSGSASAVASGAADFAVATDTAGSVRVPAAWCGVIGLRPTHGRVAVRGVMPLAPSFDTVGWMARSGSLMRAIGETLLDDARAPLADAELVRDCGLEPARGDDRAAAPEEAAGRFAERFAVVREITLGIDLSQAAQCLRVLQAREAWTMHGRWIEEFQPRFGPGVAERFRAARAVTDEQVRLAGRHRDSVIAQLDAVLPPGRMLCLPAVPGPAARRDSPPAELQAQRDRVFPLTVLASLTGRPQISLPLRVVDDAPVGLSLLGWRQGDEALLHMAAWLFP